MAVRITLNAKWEKMWNLFNNAVSDCTIIFSLQNSWREYNLHNLPLHRELQSHYQT